MCNKEIVRRILTTDDSILLLDNARTCVTCTLPPLTGGPCKLNYVKSQITAKKWNMKQRSAEVQVPINDIVILLCQDRYFSSWCVVTAALNYCISFWQSKNSVVLCQVKILQLMHLLLSFSAPSLTPILCQGKRHNYITTI